MQVSRRSFVRTTATTAVSAVASIAGSETSGGAESQPRGYPALTGSGAGWIYLDSAATTHKPIEVLDAMEEFYRTGNANPSTGSHAAARRAAELYDAARQEVAAFINAPPDELVFVRGTTEALNVIAAAWGVEQLRKGDEILLTDTEHYSNLLPWQLVARKTGANLTFVECQDDGRLDPARFEAAIGPRTRIVGLPHVSNVLGAINPLPAIARVASSKGARVVVDAAQSVPHFPIDVRALGCDAVAFSGHKMLGPMGIGGLWVSESMQRDMAPYQAGSHMAGAVTLREAVYRTGHARFEAGTPNVAGAVGLAAATRLLRAGRARFASHEAALVQRLAERLSAIERVRVIGPRGTADRVPVFTFLVDGRSVPDVVGALDRRRIAVRGGDMAAAPLLKRFGVEAAVRASAYVYSSLEDVDRFADALDEITRTA